LVEAGLRQLLDPGYVYGAIIRQRVVTMDKKHHGRERCEEKIRGRICSSLNGHAIQMKGPPHT
jgi:hypothetical protein